MRERPRVGNRSKYEAGSSVNTTIVGVFVIASLAWMPGFKPIGILGMLFKFFCFQHQKNKTA